MTLRDASCLVRKDAVVVVADVLPRPPAAYTLDGAVAALTLEGGAPGPRLRLGPLALARLGEGKPLLVMEIDERGPARATALDRKERG